MYLEAIHARCLLVTTLNTPVAILGMHEKCNKRWRHNGMCLYALERPPMAYIDDRHVSIRFHFNPSHPLNAFNTIPWNRDKISKSEVIDSPIEEATVTEPQRLFCAVPTP